MFHFEYFYIKLTMPKYEICKGLIFKVGINYDWYIPIRKASGTKSKLRSSHQMSEDVKDLTGGMYKTFTPMIGLTWTPRQYYRFNGKRKEYPVSRFPVFSILNNDGYIVFFNHEIHLATTFISINAGFSTLVGIKISLDILVSTNEFLI